jgi:hypothetical protein
VRTDVVDALLACPHGVGSSGAPRPLGRDEQGRQVLEHLPGEVGSPDSGCTTRPRSSPRPLEPSGSGSSPADREDLVVHHDPAPWNLVRGTAGWALIDWDFAGPGSRLWNLAYAARTAVPLHADRRLEASSPRLRAVIDGYGLDDAGRAELMPLLHRRVTAIVQVLRDGAASGAQPWARLWTEDGPSWQRTADHLAQHSDDRAAALS